MRFRIIEDRGLTAFNKLILGIVLFLFVVNLFSSVFIFGMFIIYVDPSWNTPMSSFVQLIAFNVFYVKDSIITLMLCYLFYYKGKQ
jgi:hypothetical protein